MQQVVGQLLSRWRADLDAPASASLCAALAEVGERQPGALDSVTAIGVGVDVESRFPDDAMVLIAVGRMYMACGELKRGLKPLALAARGGRQDAFALLGELLLHLGDARRAVLAFERAIAGHESDPELMGWLASARSYVQLQEEQGSDAVAREVARAVSIEPDCDFIDPPTVELGDPFRPEDPGSITRPRKRLPSYTQRSAGSAPSGRGGAWGDESTQVTSMTNIVAARGEIVASDDDMPTAVRDVPAVLSLFRDADARNSDRGTDVEPPTQVLPTLPALAAQRAANEPPPLRGVALPTTSDRILPVALADEQPVVSTPAQPSPIVMLSVPPARRRGGVARYLGIVALLAIAGTAWALRTGRLPLPGLLDALARGKQADETAAPPAEPTRASAEADPAPVASSASPAPTETAALETPSAPVATSSAVHQPAAAISRSHAPTASPKPLEKKEKEEPVKPPASAATAKTPTAPLWAGDPELDGKGQ